MKHVGLTQEEFQKATIYANAVADLEQRRAPWWATRQGSKKWKRIFGLRCINGIVQAQMRRKNDKLFWTEIDGLSAIRGDE